ncbi:MAG: peptidoglycan-binding protein [Richelia sp. SL_2_1]|nr:peptidoglycan-binding protein [Richelia sp. SL_2_1]
MSFRFLPINRIYWLVLLSSTPLLFGSQIGISIAAKQQTIAQVVVEANINRPNLKIGSEGVPVRELQGALILLGFYEGEVNGVFTETTQKAVVRFQQAAGLKADGVVDTNTWEPFSPTQQYQQKSRIPLHLPLLIPSPYLQSPSLTLGW